jgi:predicted PurR-regulated permease PerM
MRDELGPTSTRSLLRLILGVAGVVIILAAMWAARSMVNLILLAFLLTLLAYPLLRWLRGRGWSFRAAYLAVLVVINVALLAILLLGVLSLAQVAVNVPQYLERFQTQTATLNAGQSGVDASPLGSAANDAAASVLNTLAGVAAGMVGLIVGSVFLILIVAYMLLESESFAALLQRIVGAENPTYQRVAASTSAVVTYITITAWVNLLIAAGDVAFLWLLGVPHVLLWGVVSFIFGFIPYIGYWIALLPPLVLAFGIHGIWGAVAVLLGYWLINGLFSQLVAPRLYGKGLDLSVTLTLVAVLFWAWLLGPIGGMLAVPLTAVIKSALLANYPETAWLATVLGDSRAAKESDQQPSAT